MHTPTRPQHQANGTTDHPALTDAGCRYISSGGHVCQLRRLHRDDAPLLAKLLDGALSPCSRRSRFLGSVGQLSPERLLQLADADFSRLHAWVVTTEVDGRSVAIAEGRFVRSATGETAEFALAVADAWQRQGIGTRLMQRLVQAAEEEGMVSLQGDVDGSNAAMFALMRRCAFGCHNSPEDVSLMRVERRLQARRQRSSSGGLGLGLGLDRLLGWRWAAAAVTH